MVWCRWNNASWDNESVKWFECCCLFGIEPWKMRTATLAAFRARLGLTRVKRLGRVQRASLRVLCYFQPWMLPHRRKLFRVSKLSLRDFCPSTTRQASEIQLWEERRKWSYFLLPVRNGISSAKRLLRVVSRPEGSRYKETVGLG